MYSRCTIMGRRSGLANLYPTTMRASTARAPSL